MSSAQRFEGKVVLVTGAAQGIGQGVALRIAAEGGQVLAVDRSDIVDEVVAQIREAGGAAHAAQADLETYAGAQHVVAQCLARFGRVDVLVNNVGGTIWAKPYEHYEEQQIEAEIRRSLFPTLWCCRAVLPHMVERQQGVIVNVSSVATRGVHRVPYSAAKGGVNALTASLAMEHTRNGIRINATAPGGTDAPPRRVPRNQAPASAPTAIETQWYQGVIDQTKDSSLMHRYGTIDEQVAPILFLASDESSYITGSVLAVAGGDQG
ncbi:benzoate diol dehydrogenase BenD [Pseudorhodoferax sp. Leaf267]|uniref:benzoate diol dehydrogenase BenD n=1 Tax=Pseudorhodoferax sp. Leaf267 TaxID=1736316 RepID=UPI0006F7B330|nr:benzoate diol dehydrogenase BenD [Pseudorhodoferax sp. Leaf267]KQP13641.1 1,6-dihydroxycyclohexa-2,4-diene-1-carboxylate dehydrogenase [Pseudorhodoferax sp. Leaf267]